MQLGNIRYQIYIIAYFYVQNIKYEGVYAIKK